MFSSDVKAPAALSQFGQRWERSGGRANLEAGTLRNVCSSEMPIRYEVVLAGSCGKPTRYTPGEGR
jgi:hypothetical protein